MARSSVVNAIRYNHRQCRHPNQTPADGGRIVHLESIASIQGKLTGGQQPDSLEFDELVDELESRLSDAILREVYQLMVLGYSTFEIAAKLNWNKRTTERLIVQVRKELQPWCKSSLHFERDKRQETRESIGTRSRALRNINSSPGQLIKNLEYRKPWYLGDSIEGFILERQLI